MRANLARGVRVERSSALRQTEAGHIAFPLLVGHNGNPLGEGNPILTYDATSEPHAELGRLLADAVPPTADGVRHHE
ncbi:hypothetical protein ACFXKX_23725 [Streptomyces scopuliridis]|uniref:hypothetical protein n=1 Tax=Streptomyces scopuliridis TaxID=452529 RepID=UPI00368AA74D